MTPMDAQGRGSALVPVTDALALPRPTGVVGTVRLVDGELVVHLQPSVARDVTTRRLAREPDPEPTTLAALGFMRYVGPLTPEQVVQWHADRARLRARRWWRWWR